MRKIENYEQFCMALSGEDEEQKKKAKLLLLIQNWIIRILECVEEDTLDYSLKKLMAQKADRISNEFTLKDSLSRIVDDSELAFGHLNENMRKKIIRENVLMPVYKVREINSYGLNWLSRQSGRTIKQKVSSAGNSIMAVQRRMSFDTAENRLLVAFVKEFYEYLCTKTDSLGEIDARRIEEEAEMRDELAVFLRRDDIAEVRRWENLPPNNTLLSDQNYKKIWHAWNEIKKIDERVKNDFECMGNRLATIFLVELLVLFRETLQIPQAPVEIDYDTYNVHLCESSISCLDGEGNSVEIYKEDNRIYLKSTSKEVCVEFMGNDAVVKVSEVEEKRFEVTQDKLHIYVRFVAAKLGVKTVKTKTMIRRNETKKFNSIVVDLFSLHPGYMGDDLEYGKLTERVLQQKYTGKDIDGDLKNYYIPCDNTNAIKMISGVTDTYTIPFAVDSGSMEQMKRLVHMLENYIVTESFTYVFPDAYNELQLSMVHKAARIVYRRVRNVPLSIGTAFKYQTTTDYKRRFQPGDYLLVVNLIDDEVTFTLVAGEYNEKLENELNEHNRIVWERHPTTTTFFKDKIDDNVIDLLTKAGCAKSEKLYKLLGLNGLLDEAGSLSICFDNEWFRITPEIKKRVEQFKLNITDAVDEFLNKNKVFLQGHKIYIISLIEQLIYKGNESFCYMSKQEVLEGCKELERLEKLTDIPLWHDHLPALAIKLMYGKFDLINNATVIPGFDKRQIIPISGIFTLPKNCDEYHFNLVQDENARKMQYEAVIKNPAFPLARNVQCELKMTYQYGAEEPYELFFVPIKKRKAQFAEAKVIWKKVETYEYKNMAYPEFPSPCSWYELQHYKSDKHTSNLLTIMAKGFEQIARGYVSFDFRATGRTYSGQRGEIKVDIDGAASRISWNKSSWSKEANIPDRLGKVSFLLEEDKREPIQRYRIRDLYSCCSDRNVWFLNKFDLYQCLAEFDYQGETVKIALHESEFLDRSAFSVDVNDVSFSVVEMKNGRLKAIDIHNEEEGPYIAPNRYFAKGMREGDKPPEEFAGGQFNFSLYKTFSFANNRSLSEPECPMELQQAFSKAVDKWVDLYNNEFTDKKLKRRILLGMSLMSRDIGERYYDIANEAIELYADNKIKIADEIGCGLGDLSTEDERGLLTHMLDALPQDKIVFVLSKALWHNKDFIKNIDTEILLEYFDIAVEKINCLLQDFKLHIGHQNKTWKIARDMSVCMEYILGVFRLRELKEDVIDKEYLSLNNKSVRRLYRYIEEAIGSGIQVRSFMKFEVTNKGAYEDIPDLLYILLVYITGQSAEGEIHISGLDMERSGMTEKDMVFDN